MAQALMEFDVQHHDGFELGEVMSALLRRWPFILAMGALGLFVALFVAMTAIPRFALNGAIYLGNQPAGISASNGFLSDSQDTASVNTLAGLLQSRALIEKAVLETGVNASVTAAQQDDAGQMPYWRWKYLHRRDINAYAPQPGALVAQDAVITDPGAAGFAARIVFGQNGTFTAETSGQGRGKRPQKFSGQLDEPVSDAGISMILKPAVAGDIPKPGSAYQLSITPAKEVADQLLGGALTVNAGGGAADPSQVADLRLLWSNPYQGAAFLNRLMNDFVSMQLSWNTESASNTEAFVTGELAKVRTQMQAADKALADYQAKTGIVDVSGTAQALINQISQYETQRTALQLKQQALTQLMASLKSDKEVEPYLVSEINDPVLTTLANTLATAEVKRATQEANYTSAAPEVESQQAAINGVRRSIRELLQNNQAIATRNVQNLDAVISSAQSKLEKMPAESLEVDELTRASDVSGRLYVMLMQKEEEAEVSKAATITGSRIVSQAEVPLFATAPKVKIMLLGGLFAGLLIGAMLILMRRSFSGRFQSYEEIRRLTPTNIISTLPLAPLLADAQPRLTQSRRTPFCESIRLLRSQIYQSYADAGSVVICLTSAAAGDGKSTVAMNLARMLADDGKRTILIDADLHAGRLDEFLNMPATPGISDHLLGRRGDIRRVPGEDIHLLSAGTATPNPTELLNRPALDELFTKLREDYDYIIADCPPLPAVSDMMALARCADIVLSVLYVERTSRKIFSLHLEALRSLHCEHGIIVNGMADAKSIYGYGKAYNRKASGGKRRRIPA